MRRRIILLLKATEPATDEGIQRVGKSPDFRFAGESVDLYRKRTGLRGKAAEERYRGAKVLTGYHLYGGERHPSLTRKLREMGAMAYEHMKSFRGRGQSLDWAWVPRKHLLQAIEELEPSVPPVKPADVEGGKHIGDTPIGPENFWHQTHAHWKAAEPPKGPPHYVSPSGSEYWMTDEGVYRRADHWTGDRKLNLRHVGELGANRDNLYVGSIWTHETPSVVGHVRTGFVRYADMRPHPNLVREARARMEWERRKPGQGEGPSAAPSVAKSVWPDLPQTGGRGVDGTRLRRLATRLGATWDGYGLRDVVAGVAEEREHVGGRFGVARNLRDVVKIVLAHLSRHPGYYRRHGRVRKAVGALSVRPGDVHPTMPHLPPSTPADRERVAMRAPEKHLPALSWGVTHYDEGPIVATYHDSKGKKQYIYTQVMP